jgi:hypothetical protein
MNAAAHEALLITLLTGLSAGSGYAAGRLHQWHRTGVQRDEAYRDGYDAATRSVFSLAARLIGPRRAAPGAAAAPGKAHPHAPVTPPPSGLAPARLGSPAASSGPEAQAASAGEDAKAASQVRRNRLLSQAGPSGAGGQARPGAQVPDPGTAEGTSPGSGTCAPEAPEHEEQDAGRHYVLDELVQAETYRLPADRVARAKVPGALPADVGAGETVGLPSVPRPRSR